MNYRLIARVLGYCLLIFAGLMFLPMLAGLLFGESPLPFLKSIVITAAAGGLLLLFRTDNRSLVARDGFVIVGLGWILFSLAGSLPYVFSHSFGSFTDALFETASGLTTTGATVLTDFDGMPRGVMFWRIFTHWIGGMGVLVFLMAVLPMSGEHSMHIMRAEVPGPSVGKLVPRARHTARILYLIYIALTVLETVSLKIAGLSLYDALLHAFSTAGTGGFSPLAESVGGYHNAAAETVITVFMFLFALNFNLYYLVLIGSWRKALVNEELRAFAGIVLVSVGLITYNLCRFRGYQLGAALHDAFFNVATITSTTGFGNVDFTYWPELCKWILILLMFCGGCAGSTAGGIKLSRVMILFRSARMDVKQMSRPRNVFRVEMEGRRVENATVRASFTFVTIYLILLLLTSLLLSLDGVEIATAFTSALSCLSNVGPGMTAAVGPAGSFAFFSMRSKLLLVLIMLMGRLEFYPILVLFSPRTWKK